MIIYPNLNKIKKHLQISDDDWMRLLTSGTFYFILKENEYHTVTILTLKELLKQYQLYQFDTQSTTYNNVLKTYTKNGKINQCTH